MGVKILSLLSFISVLLLPFLADADIIQAKEDGRAAKEMAVASALINKYRKSHSGAVPRNWSDMWDAREVAWQYSSLVGRPLVHRQVAIVDTASQLTPDGSGSRIIAITRSAVPRPFGKKENNGDENPVWVDHRLIIFATKDEKFMIASVSADQPLRGMNLDNLVLKKPDLTNQQVADTARAMIEFGFQPDQIREAFGNDAIKTVQKSGSLDPGGRNWKYSDLSRWRRWKLGL